MYLLIDIGNSTIVAALASSSCKIVASWRFDTLKDQSAHYYVNSLRLGFSKHGISSSAIQACAISSVVPELNGRFVDAVYNITGKTPRFFTIADAKNCLTLDVDNPEQVGKDRLADVIGASCSYGCPAMVIDMGTATTIGVVLGGMKFAGGMIIPGVKTSHKALCDRASQLKPIDKWEAKTIIGHNTVECMQSGLIYGTACMIDGIIDRIALQYKADFVIVATGGMASTVVPYCSHNIIVDKYLLLKGLYHAVIGTL